jgi:hypothetical protein
MDKHSGSNESTLAKIFNGKNVVIRKDCHCFIFAPELSVFLGNVSYNGGLIELLTSLYEGKDKWEYRTKTSGMAELENVNVNMFGASNPEWLAKGLQDVGKRIAWPEKPVGMEETEMRIVHDLMEIAKVQGEYIITEPAKKHYQEWFDLYNPDFHGRMSGYYERKPDHILKLSMILAASQNSVREIRKHHVISAIKMLDEVEALMPKAFAYIGATSEARISQHVIELISGSDKHFISYKRLLAGSRHMIRNRREFDDIIDTLETAGAIKMYHTNGGKYLTIDADVDRVREAIENAAHNDAINAFEQEKNEDLSKVADDTTTRSTLEEKAVKLQEAIKAIAEEPV